MIKKTIAVGALALASVVGGVVQASAEPSTRVVLDHRTLSEWFDYLGHSTFSQLRKIFFNGVTSTSFVVVANIPEHWSSLLTYDSELNKVTYSGASGKAVSVNADAGGGSVVPVPGPVAGAGIPAMLILGGAAVYLRRRRSGSAVAA